MILDEVADFFESDPKKWTTEYIALRNGVRTTATNPHADQWDIIGALSKLMWEKYRVRTELGNLWFFRRIVRAINEGLELNYEFPESPILLYEIYHSGTALDVIADLRKCAQYARDNRLDNDLDLTPVAMPEVKTYRLYI